MEPGRLSPGVNPGLADSVARVSTRLDAANRGREAGLVASRAAIRASASAVRAVHRLDHESLAAHLAAAEVALRQAQTALAPFPAVAHAGFLHDAEKEVVEAHATAALVEGRPVPTADELRVGDPAWLNGVAEAASELRRHTLDRLRAGDLPTAERLLAAMDDVFGELVVIDLPDALSGGLRRTLDALRAVIERTRGDVTHAVVLSRLPDVLAGGVG